ncbi:MAG: glycosyltransferase [Selenomonadaceae bacterium]|nr:glycosyltransferase [Selenomonadaceae bacterium]MBQ1509838.1 glycosyltransferase [Selenomonadaceae bacterium]
MTKKRKFLIMTASIGSGHIRAAEAVERELRRQFPGDDIQIVDFMSRKTSIFHGMLKSLYLRMLDFVPNLYDVFYKVSGDGSSGVFAQTMFAVVMCHTMCRIVKEYEPDVLICTHPFPEGAAALARRLGRRDEFLLAAVLTDYSLHQIWIYPKVDLYFTATEEMREGLLAKGFSPEQVFASGIAVAENILGAPSREEARRGLGMDADAKAVLLMGGGLGLGGIQESLKDMERIKRPLSLLVIAGRNLELQQKVEQFGRASHHEVKVWGYTDRVYELMSAADILITKPGALTMSEAFVLGLPMLLHEPIPGPETKNAVYASDHGAAVWVHHGESIAEAVEKIVFDEERLGSMRRQALSCARPHAAHDIVGVLSSLLADRNS